jgi:hypothetical protein
MLLRPGLGILLGAFFLLGMESATEAEAQTNSSSEVELVPKKDCDYDFTDLPGTGVMTEGKTGSLHEFVCRWAVVRRLGTEGFALNFYTKPLDSLRVDEHLQAYMLKMEAPNMEDKANQYDELYVVVSNQDRTYYDRLPGKKHEDGDPWHLRSFRTVDVPEAKRKYLWTEFYEAYPERNRDTTQAYWTGRVHTFSLSDSPSLQPIDKYVSLRSPCAEEAGPDASIPIRDMKIVGGEVVEASQIDVRFPRPGIAVITPRSDLLTEILQSWLGGYAMHSSVASEPMSAVEGIISDTSGCDAKD